MERDDDSFVRLVDQIKLEWLGEPTSSPREVWHALRDAAARLDDGWKKLDHDRAELVHDTSPMGRALAAIKLAREHGLELQSATWDGAEEWRLCFYLPYKDVKDSTPTPNPKLASRLIVDEDKK